VKFDDKNIVLKGVRTHNLKNFDISIPRGELVVITGPSGSGKSSLAFDTIYAEGQRRYVESLSSYARQFLGIMDKPDVDSIDGLSPSISIEQKTVSHNPRSTVGTTTEIYDYLRLLFARVGDVHCYECEKEISKQSSEDIVTAVLKRKQGERLMICSPIVRSRKGEFRKEIEFQIKEGFNRFLIDGDTYDLSTDDQPVLEKYKKHDISVIVDRIVVNEKSEERIKESIELALKLSGGFLDITDKDLSYNDRFSENFACPTCEISYDEIEPRLFSFNAPQGACPSCSGLGSVKGFDFHACIDTLGDDAYLADAIDLVFEKVHTHKYVVDSAEKLVKQFKISKRKKLKNFTEVEREKLGKGNTKIKGLDALIEQEFKNNIFSFSLKRHFKKFITYKECSSCGGVRLRKESLSILVNKKNIGEITNMGIEKALSFFKDVSYDGQKDMISKPILKEVLERLTFLNDVGVGYLSMDRSTSTLSGGEAQRIRLATQIGSKLTGVIYILDEPSIGLHSRDNMKLIQTLISMRDLGNTVIVVEHDLETIEHADYLVDIGPGAGEHGGEITAVGTPKQVARNKKSLTGKYMSGKLKIEIPTKRRKGNGEFIELSGATGNNLKNIDLKVPLGMLVCVTGVSGSGKSSLINSTLYPVLYNKLNKTNLKALPYKSIKNIDAIDKIIDIDQSPIGKTPRSNPATYTSIFGEIRTLYAALRESKIRGYKPGKFSFNVKGGRCEHCEGAGVLKIEMNFLPDVYVKCDECNGSRYGKDVLQVKYKGKSIADVLYMPVSEALAFFEDIPKLKRKLAIIESVGLGYIRLGQSSVTLSGGEAQRVKIATELMKVPTGKTLYILDEPTTGLHMDDVKTLLKVINELVDRGNTAIVIEHNMDVIKCADHIVDIGLEGGDKGGELIFSGSPEKLANNEISYTAKFVKEELNR